MVAKRARIIFVSDVVYPKFSDDQSKVCIHVKFLWHNIFTFSFYFSKWTYQGRNLKNKNASILFGARSNLENKRRGIPRHLWQ